MSASPKTGAVQNADGTAGRRELLAWALYDFANSGYTTVVLTTIFSAYFVAIVAGEAPDLSPGAATLLWTLAVGSANLAVLISAPAVGAIADHRAMKKAFSSTHYHWLCGVHCSAVAGGPRRTGSGDDAVHRLRY
jgi:UMF1 family MFS transporter